MGFNTDDSSTSLGLSHGAVLHSSVLNLAEKRAQEKAAYLEEIGVQNETELLTRIPRNASDGEVERRMQKYLEEGYDTVTALDMAESESGPDRRNDYLGDSIENLMLAPVEPSGGGSRSKGRSTTKKPDATVVAQALIRQSAA